MTRAPRTAEQKTKHASAEWARRVKDSTNVRRRKSRRQWRSAAAAPFLTEPWALRGEGAVDRNNVFGGKK